MLKTTIKLFAVKLVMLTKVFTRVTFSNVIEFKNYFPNLDFCEVTNWLQWRWGKSSLFHLHCCATGQFQNSSGQQQWLGSCIARLPVHHCPSAATIAAAVGGAQVLSSIIFFTMLLLCCTGHAEGLRQQRSCADGSAPDPEQLCSVSVVTGAGVGGGRLQADAQWEGDRRRH